MAAEKPKAGQDIEWLDPDGPPKPQAAPAPQITAPRASDFVPNAGTFGDVAVGAAEGLGNLLEGVPSMVAHPIETGKNIANTLSTTYNLGRQGQYVPAAATAMGLLGFNEPEMAREWSAGHGGEAVGQAIPNAALMAYGGEKALGRGDITVGGKPLLERIPMPTDVVLKHPQLTRGASMLGGYVLGSKVGGEYGLGEIGGLFAGRSLGNDIVAAAENRAIDQAIEGVRDPATLSTKAFDAYQREVIGRAERNLRIAQMTGQDPETIKAPVSVREAMRQLETTRIRQLPDLPRGVLTPEEAGQEAQGASYWRAVKARMEPEGSAIGQAHQTYRQKSEEVPSGRAAERTTTNLFRVRPRISIREK